jgi:flagellar biosynthesis/type III secretory pathway protein FliH
MPKTIEERLDAHPELKAQLLALLELAESGIERADEVEERTVESVRSLGRQVIQDWAEQQEQTISQSVRGAVGDELEQKGKKNSTGPRRTER